MAQDPPLSSMSQKNWSEQPAMPSINDNDSFPELLDKLSTYFVDAIHAPHSFEDMRLPTVSQNLNPLIETIADLVHNRAIVHALLALKGYFTALESDESRGVNLARGVACEYVAWRFLTHLSGRELIFFLLYELPPSGPVLDERDEEQGFLERGGDDNTSRTQQSTGSLNQNGELAEGVNGEAGRHSPFHEENDDFVASFDNLNALEVAAVTNAKKFLAQRVVQRVIESIWKGDIVFWETLDVGSEKEAKLYNKRKADPYCRLRVPRYLKAFEALFLVSFVIVYLAVLIPVQRNSLHRPRRPGVPPLTTNSLSIEISTPTHNFHHVTAPEVLLYIWIIAFAYDEFGEYLDAGTAFYATDFWSLWDIGIVAIGLAFFIARMTGMYKESDDIIGTAFDILALQALFLVPRLCSILSLNPYFGTIIPCLREMTKDFFKFLSIVAILYLGFLTTFTLLARDNFSLREMSWILVKVFFGSSYLGFDVAQDISPALGPPLMLVFVTLTNILLITSLISLLSNSLSRILEHARDEYLFIYSIYVLEASTSNRLTYFFPPLNLIPLLLRPIRLFVAPAKLRKIRIFLLKITHAPLVAAIWIYEGLYDHFNGSGKQSALTGASSFGGPSDMTTPGLRSYLLRSSTLMGTASQMSLAPGKDDRTKRFSRPTTSSAIPQTASQDDLKALVLQLSAQVQDLKAMIGQQQGVQESSD